MKHVIFLLVVACFSDAFGINTVPSLNVTQYLGRWYQMYADATVMETFERDAVCVTADYSLQKDGKIGVLNSERLKTETGDAKNITGYAYVPDPKEPGKLKVHLEGTPFDAPYWVVKLGLPSFGDNGLYQYSVITDNLQATLFVLARDVDTFRNQFDEEVTTWLEENGFTHFWNKPVPTLQNKNCLYAGERASPYQTLREFLGQE
ncbi:outer membrane lipoprotein Blc-like isoform X3 [Oculina patagonica]